MTLLLDQEMCLLLLPMGGKVLLVIRTRTLSVTHMGYAGLCKASYIELGYLVE